MFSNRTRVYSYGFNGKENDDEVKGTGNQQDYGMRIYDPRLGRFLSVDPISRDYPSLTPYQFAGNSPIQFIDADGLEPAKTYNGVQNLVIVVQGYNGADPPNGKTQAQNNSEGIDLSGLGGAIGVANPQTQVVVFSSSNTSNTVEDIAATINNFKKMNPNGKVVLVGHSLGAENVVEVAQDNKNITIDLFIAVDAHDLIFEPTSSTIPSNIKKVINYFQTEDKRGISGQQYKEEDKSTTGINKEVKNTGGHTEIDNKLSETIKTDIFNFTEGKDAVKEAAGRTVYPQNDTKNETFNQPH